MGLNEHTQKTQKHLSFRPFVIWVVKDARVGRQVPPPGFPLLASYYQHSVIIEGPEARIPMNPDIITDMLSSTAADGHTRSLRSH